MSTQSVVQHFDEYDSESSRATESSQIQQPKLQPWTAFVTIPPTLRDAEQMSGPIRLKSEKDDKGLGG
jgi:hypothetical protein